MFLPDNFFLDFETIYKKILSGLEHMLGFFSVIFLSTLSHASLV